MRALISLLALACVGASLLASTPEVSIGFVVAAIVLASSAVGTYIFGELRMARPSRAHGPVDMRRFSRPIPVQYVDPVRRSVEGVDRAERTA
jgi:hypothetical protein